MRTTMELPPDVMRAAKSRAAARGESLKNWLTRTIKRALGRSRPTVESQRVQLPIISSMHPGKTRLTNADIAALEAADDLERYRRSER